MRDDNQQGILIAIEGIDGAGKTSQVSRLCSALIAAGEDVVASKEPTTGIWGQRIRHSAQHGRMSPQDELQAFLADREEHVDQLIAPALANGKVVVLDRYFYSTVAYQGARSALDPCDFYRDMRSRFPVPDVTYLIDVLPEVGLDRVERVRGDEPNHFERLDLLVNNRATFLRLLGCAPEMHRIDGHPDVESVYQQIAKHLVDGVLKAKRCLKPYDCDVLYCAYRMSGECRWPRKRAAILSHSVVHH